MEERRKKGRREEGREKVTHMGEREGWKSGGEMGRMEGWRRDEKMGRRREGGGDNRRRDR